MDKKCNFQNCKTWNVNNRSIQNAAHENDESHLAQILPAEYKPMDITELIQKQSHLTPDEHEQLQNALFSFQPLFQGKHGEFKGEPITLELLPGSNPFYGKPFTIPKTCQQVKKMKLPDWNQLDYSPR